MAIRTGSERNKCKSTTLQTVQVTTDYYGRRIPKQAHGSINLDRQTASTRLITDAAMELFDRIVDRNLLVRRMYVVANHVVSEDRIRPPEPEQLDLFTDYAELEKQREMKNRR